MLAQRLKNGGAWIRSIFDAASPSPVEGEASEEARRARILRGFMVVLVLLGVETSVVFRAGLREPHLADRVDVCMLLALGTVYYAHALSRRPGRIDLAANFVLASAMLVIVACLSVIGGIAAPLVHWVGVVPMLAVLLCGRRGAIAWAGIAISMVVGLIGADALHLDLGNAGIFENETRSALWAYKFIDVSSWCVMFLAVSLLYEHIRVTQTAVVASKNQALEEEVRQRAMAEERTHRLAYYDELTGLPNRSSFQQALQRAMAHAERNRTPMAIMLLDLDGFKAVNDTRGHALGDELLVEVARRLKCCTRPADQVTRGKDDAVSRLGGDEFTILIESLGQRREAATVAARVLDVMREPFMVGGQEIYISASIGIALHPGPADSIDALLRSADMAMYHAKENGKNSLCFFEESMNEDVQRRMRIATELRYAIEDEQFALYYQPIVAAADGTIVGAEALIRWRHPHKGIVAPGEFIEVAEETGLILPIGAWVLDEACRQLAAWTKEGLELGRLSVNVSAVQLRGGVIQDQLTDVLSRHAVAPSSLDLEITENAILVDEVEASDCLRALKALGVRVSLDDFGTGYSSLSYVKRFPVDALKIDRSFTSDPEHDADACGISAAIVSMGRHLHLRTVGEGVETPLEAEWLRKCGCDELQGYLFAPPLPATEFAQFLRAGGRPLQDEAKEETED